MSKTPNMLPNGCGYQGYEFGASYPDSACYGGRLYDCDNCDDAGNLYEPGDYIPCPMCHPKLYAKNRMEFYGWDAKSAKSFTDDIRRNRKNGTEPWKRLEAK